MAEFLEQAADEKLSGFDAMGLEVPTHRKEAGYSACKEMGLDSARSYECVSGMCEAIQRDNPYHAMEVGMRHLDLTGTYRLMAVLLTAEE